MTVARVAVRAPQALAKLVDPGRTYGSRSLHTKRVVIRGKNCQRKPVEVKEPAKLRRTMEEECQSSTRQVTPVASKSKHLGCTTTVCVGSNGLREPASTSKGKLTEEATSKSSPQVGCTSLAALTSLGSSGKGGIPVLVHGCSASTAASFRKSETPSTCGGTVQIDRRLEAQFVITRFTSSRCQKALSGSSCGTGCMFRRMRLQR